LDPAFAPTVVGYLNDWYAAGGGLFIWFNYVATSYNGQYGTWGVTNDINNLATPKLLAIKNVTSSPLPKVTAGTVLPGSIRGGDKVDSPDNSGVWKVIGINCELIS
jgi:hypothetical protein